MHQRVGVVGGDNLGSRLTPSASRPVGMAMLGSRPPSRLAANFTFCSRSSLSNAGAEATRPSDAGLALHRVGHRDEPAQRVPVQEDRKARYSDDASATRSATSETASLMRKSPRPPLTFHDRAGPSRRPRNPRP